MELEERLKTMEEAIRLLHRFILEAEGRVHALQSALFAIIEFAEKNDELTALIRRNMEIGTVVALNSQESQAKADAAEAMIQTILSMLPPK